MRITKDLDPGYRRTGCHPGRGHRGDSGMTLNYMLGYLRSKSPASLEVCALLNKRARRIVDIPLRYVGFEVPDEFVVGYGLDFQEKYRNLPFIGALKPDFKLRSPQNESPQAPSPICPRASRASGLPPSAPFDSGIRLNCLGHFYHIKRKRSVVKASFRKFGEKTPCSAGPHGTSCSKGLPDGGPAQQRLEGGLGVTAWRRGFPAWPPAPRG